MKAVRRAAIPRFKESDLRRAAAQILAIVGAHGSAVPVFLVSDRVMRVLKLKFRGERRRIVDVLAFPEPAGFPHPESPRRVIGEVYVNGDRHGGDPERLLYLLTHGILHLLGYRHQSKRDMMVMEKQTQRIVKELSG